MSVSPTIETSEVSNDSALSLKELFENAKFGRFHVFIILQCGLIAMFDGFDTQSIAFVAPVLMESWNVSSDLFGPVFGAGLAGLMIGQFLLGPVADKFGRRKVILGSTFFFGLCTFLTAFVNNLTALLVLRFLTGIGLGGAMPNIIALTAEYAPPRLRATMVTIMFSGFPLGAVVGGYISSYIIPTLGCRCLY